MQKLLLTNGWSVLLMAVCLSCRPSYVEELLVDVSTASVQHKRGICYLNDTPFSGGLVELNAKGDTLQITRYLHGREHGKHERFYDDGSPIEIRYYKHGKKDNLLQAWWPNGQLKTQVLFVDGEYEGVLQEWNEHGQLVKSLNYHHGQPDGLQQAWYDNGKVRSNFVIANGRRYGLLGTKNCINVSDSIFIH